MKDTSPLFYIAILCAIFWLAITMSCIKAHASNIWKVKDPRGAEITVLADPSYCSVTYRRVESECQKYGIKMNF